MAKPLTNRDVLAKLADKVPRGVWVELYKADDRYQEALYQLADELLAGLDRRGWDVVKRPTAKK